MPAGPKGPGSATQAGLVTSMSLKGGRTTRYLFLYFCLLLSEILCILDRCYFLTYLLLLFIAFSYSPVI